MTLTTTAQRLVGHMRLELTPQLPPGCLEREVGVIALLKELPVAADGVDRGVLSEASAHKLATEVAQRVRKDPGVGAGIHRIALSNQLKGSKTTHVNTASIALISEQIDSLERNYLTHWRGHLQAQEEEAFKEFTGYEYASLQILSHLLTSGLTANIIDRSLGYIESSDITHTASDVINHFEDRINRGPKHVTCLLLLEQPVSPSIHGENWMSAGKVRDWAHSQGLLAEVPRGIHGAIPVTGNAWDKWQLFELVSSARASIIGRARAMTGRDMRISQIVLTDAFDRIVKITDREDRHPRTARYEFQDLTLGATDSSQIAEAAMEFYTSARRSTSPAAKVSLLWAAIEVLFSEPGTENIECAGRAADFASIRQTKRLVSVGMIMLSSNQGDAAYAASVEGKSDEQAYSEFIKYIKEEKYAGVRSERCRKLLPVLSKRMTAGGIVRFRESIEVLLRHLYRGRNLAIHGGVTDSPIMRPIGRVAEPFVAAAIDYTLKENAKTREDVLLLCGRASLRIDTLSAIRSDRQFPDGQMLTYSDIFSPITS
ncbi:hypothetical protein [Brachybacterium alimentarium]|uniref:hypothetical protein n=1 Tax=Brachybacterium alimentarium TaxID=47845 RepID=UPI003FD43BC9